MGMKKKRCDLGADGLTFLDAMANSLMAKGEDEGFV